MSILLEMAARHGVKLKKASSHKGGEYQGPCPGCGGDDRFHIWPAQNGGSGSYWCRQCGKSGDAIQFLRDFERLSFKDACNRLNMPVPDLKSRLPNDVPAGTWEAPNYDDPTELWRTKAMKFCVWAFDQIFQEDRVINWLAGRGIRESTIVKIGLGWNCGKSGKDIFRNRESWGLPQILNKNKKRKALWLPRGLLIPYSIENQIRRIRIRRQRPVEFGPPYYVIPGSSMMTMVLGMDRRCFVVVESELDAILIYQEIGDLVGVVALGSSSTKPDKTTYEILKESDKILMALDFDRAGINACSWWKRKFHNCKFWPVPKGKDPGEAYQSDVDIRAWIKAGLPPSMTIGET